MRARAGHLLRGMRRLGRGLRRGGRGAAGAGAAGASSRNSFLIRILALPLTSYSSRSSARSSALEPGRNRSLQPGGSSA